MKNSVKILGLFSVFFALESFALNVATFNDLKTGLVELSKAKQITRPHLGNILSPKLDSLLNSDEEATVIGRTRGGKSTFLSTIIDPFDQNLHDVISKDSLFSHTVNPESYVAIFESHTDGLYAARFIDTPGSNDNEDIVKYQAQRYLVSDRLCCRAYPKEIQFCAVRPE